MICFADWPDTDKCEVFDTTGVTETHSTKYDHKWGGLGYYQGQPTTVVGSVAYDAMKKVETFNESTGWTSLPDHPMYEIFSLSNFISFSYYMDHSLIGLDNGAMLMLGGRVLEDSNYGDIWQLKEDIWTRIGYLKEVILKKIII